MYLVSKGKYYIDEIDYKIIEILKCNGKQSNTQLSNRLFISSHAICKRRSKLEKQGIITQYPINFSLYKTAFIEIYMNNSKFNQLEKN